MLKNLVNVTISYNASAHIALFGWPFVTGWVANYPTQWVYNKCVEYAYYKPCVMLCATCSVYMLILTYCCLVQ